MTFVSEQVEISLEKSSFSSIRKLGTGTSSKQLLSVLYTCLALLHDVMDLLSHITARIQVIIIDIFFDFDLQIDHYVWAAG